MVERIVLIKLLEEHRSGEKRTEIAQHSRQVLPRVPGVRAVWVGVPADDRCAQSWDLCLIVRFDSVEDIPAYASHPKHRSYVDEYLRPRMEGIAAYNFQVG